MGMSAMLTLQAMTNYRTDLFDNLQLPVPPTDAAAIGLQADQLRAAWTINKADFVKFLCLQTMGMSLAYPDPNFMKSAIGAWSGAHIHEWQRMYDTLFYKYNPLWNKDGIVTESGWDVNEGESTTENTGANVGYVHSYNDGATTIEGLAWDHSNRQDGTASGESSASGQSSFSHSRLEQGNIGVTMSQELIAKERELAMYSIEEYLADEFKKQFCLMIW